MNLLENPAIWVAIIGLIGVALGYVVKMVSDRSTSKTTAKTSREQRIDEKIDNYTDRIEARLGKVEEDAEEARAKADELEEQVKVLTREKKTLEREVHTLRQKVEAQEVERALADRRELLLYRHTKALRDHIVNELPPPPPTAPTELIDWFANFEDTEPGRPAVHSI